MDTRQRQVPYWVPCWVGPYQRRGDRPALGRHHRPADRRNAGRQLHHTPPTNSRSERRGFLLFLSWKFEVNMARHGWSPRCSPPH